MVSIFHVIFFDDTRNLPLKTTIEGTLLPDAVMVAATVTRCPSFAAVRKLIVRRPTTSMVTVSSIEWYTGVWSILRT